MEEPEGQGGAPEPGVLVERVDEDHHEGQQQAAHSRASNPARHGLVKDGGCQTL